jgi:hypothetical protein
MADEQTDREQRLRDACVTGARVDLAHADDRRVPAELIIDLLTRPLRAGEVRRGVKLAGAQVAGALDLEAAALLCQLSLSDCTLSSLDATQLHTRGGLSMADSQATGRISHARKRREEPAHTPRDCAHRRRRADPAARDSIAPPTRRWLPLIATRAS